MTVVDCRMTPRDLINDMISDNGYDFYLYVMENWRGWFEAELLYINQNDFDLLAFYEFIIAKLKKSLNTGVVSPRYNMILRGLEHLLFKISQEATEEEKVFIAMKYKLTL